MTRAPIETSPCGSVVTQNDDHGALLVHLATAHYSRAAGSRRRAKADEALGRRCYFLPLGSRSPTFDNGPPLPGPGPPLPGSAFAPALAPASALGAAPAPGRALGAAVAT